MTTLRNSVLEQSNGHIQLNTSRADQNSYLDYRSQQNLAQYFKKVDKFGQTGMISASKKLLRGKS